MSIVTRGEPEHLVDRLSGYKSFSESDITTRVQALVGKNTLAFMAMDETGAVDTRDLGARLWFNWDNPKQQFDARWVLDEHVQRVRAGVEDHGLERPANVVGVHINFASPYTNVWFAEQPSGADKITDYVDLEHPLSSAGLYIVQHGIDIPLANKTTEYRGPSMDDVL